ncbi:MAG: peptide deformylase [Gloeomargarita sp. GMQP_bins_120]
MATRTILQCGHPLLHQPAQPVLAVDAAEVQALAQELVQVCLEAQGVGLAAPQIGVPWQILVVASRPNPRYPTAPTMAPLVMINPEITATAGEPVWGWEGCLSVPNRRGLVARAPWIQVRYLDLQGREMTQEFTDFVARIVQHEYDHLQGRLFLDRRPQRLLSEAEYRAQVLRA